MRAEENQSQLELILVVGEGVGGKEGGIPRPGEGVHGDSKVALAAVE